MNGLFDFQGMEVGNMIKIRGILKQFVMGSRLKITCFYIVSFKWLNSKVLNSIALL